ncbi:DUF2828 family protein [uncultured Ruminococcus sp.]|uniref:DUF2828 family protein n=1 Tax=uncultured Ruminococcus sp. TaxID=165186 RepID=UPI0025E51233|nr:DUF2828 family protein [uncultured Ruminococcus sp.]
MKELLISAANRTYTENGAVAHYSTLSDCLDLFAFVGSMRGQSDKFIIDAFVKAFIEAPDLALRIIFYARDVRGGLGERDVFRKIIKYLACTVPESVSKNLHLIPEYGRYDDLYSLFDTPCEDEMIQLIKDQLTEDADNMVRNKNVSLLAKWMPSVNTSSAKTRAFAKKFCKSLGLSEKKYRRLLSELRSYIDVVEKRMCGRDYTFDYEKLPSKALFDHRKAFYRNDRERYSEYLRRVREGKSVMHTGTLVPYNVVNACYDIIESCVYRRIDSEDLARRRLKEIEVLNTTWNALADYTDGRNALAVIDTSGSMLFSESGNNIPLISAAALGIYLADKNTGYFAKHFMVFSQKARMIELKGETIIQKVNYLLSKSEIANTNVKDVFDVILRTATENNVPQNEMPSVIYLLSDMEFDEQEGTNKTVFENAKEKYRKNGYTLPTIVFWNMAARHSQYPVTKHETGAVLVSGFSPTLFSMAMSTEITPAKFMAQVLENDRYKNICA